MLTWQEAYRNRLKKKNPKRTIKSGLSVSNNSYQIALMNSDVIDITEIVEKAIISTLPIKRLCKEDCKGLCQSCGANLNKEECSCNNEDIDLRLADLKALLNNKEV